MSTHLEQKLAGIHHSLSAAGIGTAYHRATLKDVNMDLYNWCTDGALVAVREGRGLTLVGTDKAYAAAMLTARALHLQNFASFVVPLRRLVKWLDHDTDELERAANVRGGLFVTGFHRAGDSPMQLWQRDNVEEFLTERLDNGRTIFVQGERPVVKAGWWSDTFVKALAGKNTDMVIKG